MAYVVCMIVRQNWDITHICITRCVCHQAWWCTDSTISYMAFLEVPHPMSPQPTMHISPASEKTCRNRVLVNSSDPLSKSSRVRTSTEWSCKTWSNRQAIQQLERSDMKFQSCLNEHWTFSSDGLGLDITNLSIQAVHNELLCVCGEKFAQTWDMLSALRVSCKEGRKMEAL